MGHKVHPVGFRIGVIRDWQAKWYADRHYGEFLQEDLKLRKSIQERYGEAAVSLVEIERQANRVSMTIHTARPGIVIGRGGQRVDETRAHLEQLIGKKVQLNIQEIQRPELDAYLVAKTIAEQIERRVAFRRAMKQATLRTMQAGAKGVRVSCSGRLGGAEIARRLTMHEGQVPLHTMRADIDYGFVEARTPMGRIGVKVWIYKGEILPELKEEVEEVSAEIMPEETVEDIAAEPTAEAVAEEAPAEAPKEEVAEPVAEAVAEEAPAEAAEEEPAKPAAKKRTTKKKEEVAEPVAEAAAEEAAAETAEEEPAKPAAKKRTTKKKEEATEPVAEAGAEEATAEEGENDAAA